ncbi:GDSL-type esterase/lipase family protein [Bacillus cereus]|uniref:GDSL-type esterase/lipase family protein n=1 Tax=Bacillus cereus TaxID=1396 RepID=UPI002404EA3A|nr:GDSL-type esterase/lipase family protein [Bacillus cereus]MDF9528420.1 SGNH/GDSL hydrolase family protein [Bacillus cereus]MDG1576420.1 SGNH/GDSL hydrolase family protein [Bacillus cereus]
MKKIVDEAHAKGLWIYGGTLTPYRGATFTDYFTEEGEVTRDRVNTWIRSSGVFDGVIDFEKALADPNDPDKMIPAYDSGDDIHPNDAGYKAMAEAIDLSIFNPGK